MKKLFFISVMAALVVMGCSGTGNNTNPKGNDVTQNNDVNKGTDVQQDNQQQDIRQKDMGTDRTTADSGVCQPSCWYKECGDNGCGGSCGECKTGFQCKNNKCVKKECDLTAFQVAKSGAEWKHQPGVTDKGFFTYYEVSSTTYPLSQLIFRIRQAEPFAGPTKPGTFKIGGNNLDSDSLQVIGLEDCPGPDKPCAHYYYGAQGTIEVKKLNGANGPFEAVFHNAKLKEISLTQSGMQFVNGGKTWCLDGYTIKADTVTPLPKQQCVAQGTGRGLYDNIADFTLTNCLGQKMNLHSQCGKFKLMWLTVAAKWCPHCQANVPRFWKYYTQHKDQINYWVYLAEGQYQQSPTQADCKAFAQQTGVDPAHMFIGDSKWTTIFQNFDILTNQVGYPFSFVMDGSNMSYLWSTGLGGDPTAEIDQLLQQ